MPAGLGTNAGVAKPTPRPTGELGSVGARTKPRVGTTRLGVTSGRGFMSPDGAVVANPDDGAGASGPPIELGTLLMPPLVARGFTG